MSRRKGLEQKPPAAAGTCRPVSEDGRTDGRREAKAHLVCFSSYLILFLFFARRG